MRQISPEDVLKVLLTAPGGLRGPGNSTTAGAEDQSADALACPQEAPLRGSCHRRGRSQSNPVSRR